ncbi:MAG: hypothetical protein DRO40_07050 [Thermoprotei archaeon]|nr:MAG: hypothetical protein DRO40_07050 [Thermoprotei archaeon]
MIRDDRLIRLLRRLSQKPESLASGILITYLRSIHKGDNPYMKVSTFLLRNVLYKSKRPTEDELKKITNIIINNLKKESLDRIMLKALYYRLSYNKRMLVEQYIKDC